MCEYIFLKGCPNFEHKNRFMAAESDKFSYEQRAQFQKNTSTKSVPKTSEKKKSGPPPSTPSYLIIFEYEL
jgi:hypothetical protein